MILLTSTLEGSDSSIIFVLVCRKCLSLIIELYLERETESKLLRRKFLYFCILCNFVLNLHIFTNMKTSQDYNFHFVPLVSLCIEKHM